MQEGLNDIEQAIRTLSAYFTASHDVITRSAFRTFAAETLKGVGSWGQFAWIPRVPRDQRLVHEHAAAEDGLTDYRINEKGADDHAAAAANRDEYFPVFYVAGTLKTSEAPGFDIGSDTLQIDAMERARDSGRLAASSPFGMRTDAGTLLGIAVFAPVYRSGSSNQTVEDRRRDLVGFARGIFAPSLVFASILHAVKSPRGIDIQFFEAAATASDLPFFVRSSLLRSSTLSAHRQPLGELETGLHSSIELAIGGARWIAVVVPIGSAPLIVERTHAFILLIAGLIATALVAAYLDLLTRQRRRLEAALDAISEANARLQSRDALLHAVAVSATELVTASSLDDAIPEALEMVGTTLRIDRISVLDRPPTADLAPTLRFAWQAPDLKFTLDNRFFEDPALMTPQIAAWQAPLWDGKIIKADLSSAVGDLKEMLKRLGSKSLLVLPVAVGRKFWGEMGLESCQNEREWPVFEIEELQLLADLIGSAIQRERYVQELTDANRIVQDTPTILYRLRGEPSLPMIYISQNVKLFGYEPGMLTASPQLYQSLIHPDDVAAFREAMAHAPDGRGGEAQLRILTGHGDYRWVENRYAPVCDSAGRLVEIEGLIIDITERKAAEEKIALLARTDPLTGLPNRATFMDRLGLFFAAAQRGAAPFAVLYLDLDRFKDVNDTLGHPVGDRLLVTVGERLKSTIRHSDVAARLGGDEFAVLQTALSDNADAGTLASKIRAALAVPLQIAGSELRITASVGIAVYTPDTAAPEDMLAQADAALYRAKEEGRDQYRFHTEELDRQVSERVAIADDLRGAIERNQLELYYQPQVDLDSGRIVGMEALIRWNHPTRGVVAPATFLQIAETTGTMTAIGQWVLDRACRQMSLWRRAGIAPPILAVNVSLVQLKKPDEFIGLVSETLAKWGLAPVDLELDVTELMLAHSVLAQSDVLQRLQRLGVTIAIDDFGTKYSSLDYLRTYHVGRLKIPRVLIDSAAHDPNGAGMVRAIIGIARELNVEVVAQGVETKEQWSFLSATSPATKVQGYYYSEPVPAARAEALLRQGRIGPAVSFETHIPQPPRRKRAL